MNDILLLNSFYKKDHQTKEMINNVPLYLSICVSSMMNCSLLSIQKRKRVKMTIHVDVMDTIHTNYSSEPCILLHKLIIKMNVQKRQ